MSTDDAIEQSQQAGSALAKELAALVVQDDASYRTAGAYRVQIKAHLAHIDEVTTPMLVAARANLEAARAQDKALREPALDALKLVDTRMSGYVEQTKRAAAAAQAQVATAQRQAQAAAVARALAEAQAARALDAEVAGVAVEDVPMPAPRPVMPVFVPPAAVAPPPKAEGVSSRELWGAEVYDFPALVKAVAAGHVEPAVLLPNTTTLNGLARTLKSALNIPGVRAVAKRIMAGTAT